MLPDMPYLNAAWMHFTVLLQNPGKMADARIPTVRLVKMVLYLNTAHNRSSKPLLECKPFQKGA